MKERRNFLIVGFPRNTGISQFAVPDNCIEKVEAPKPRKPLSRGAPVSVCGKMVSLKLQKRLAASVLKCGTRKIWMDPNEVWISRFCTATSPFEPFENVLWCASAANARSRLSNDPVPSKLVLRVLHDEHDTHAVHIYPLWRLLF